MIYAKIYILMIEGGVRLNYINLPPYAPILMESTRAIGYSLEAAIADIIDNCIAASARNIWVSFFPIGEAYISVLDDGEGMDSSQLTLAMQYGSKNPSETRAINDLGRFGLGLKTASLSQCKELTVISKQGERIEGRRWDLDYVAISGEWSLAVLESHELDELPQFDRLRELNSGTLVIWKKLDRLKLGEINFEQAMGRKMDDVTEHVSLVYHRYLTGEPGIKKITIAINDMKVISADPFLIGKSIQAMDDEVLNIRGEKVIVKPYILPHISKLSSEDLNELGGKEGLRKRQGFYVYRNKRLLIWGTWFRMMRQGELSKLARIQVDIPNALDDLWTLDIKKSSATPPAEVKLNLNSIIEKMADKSKRTWTFRGRKELDDNIQHFWSRFKGKNGGIYYEINREHPLIDNLVNEHPELKKSINMIFKQIEQNIPLNQLYLDLNNDESINNETDLNVKEVKNLLKELTASMIASEKCNFINKMKYVEPFCAFPDVLTDFISEES